MTEEKKDKELLNKEELLKDINEKLEQMPTKELVSVMATDLASVGFRKLGLHDKKQKDLDQAKLAIDSLEALYAVLDKHLDEKEKEVIKAALSNLKMTYVKERG